MTGGRRVRIVKVLITRRDLREQKRDVLTAVDWGRSGFQPHERGPVDIVERDSDWGTRRPRERLRQRATDRTRGELWVPTGAERRW